MSPRFTFRAATRCTGALTLALLGACSPSRDRAKPTDAPKATAMKASVVTSPFGRLPSGQELSLYTLTNANGIELRATNYGGIITSLKTPDRTGAFADIVLGYDRIEGYLMTTPYFGAIIGRYGNRIAKGRFTIDGASYSLATNNGPNALHGGTVGFDKVIWHAEPFDSAGLVGVVFTYTSKNGEEGYPGTLQARVTYTLNDRNEFSVDYHATTDKATPVNLTQHTYFNLAGAGSGPVLDQQIAIDADAFTPIDLTLIPTGVIQPVAGTPFDLRTLTAIGAHIGEANEQLKNAGGYDHNFVLTRSGDGLQHAARAVDPKSGRTLDVATTEPGIQFYTGNFLDGSITGKDGKKYAHRTGFCLETQHYPDSPNQKAFPNTILRPGETYGSRTVFTFGVAK